VRPLFDGCDHVAVRAEGVVRCSPGSDVAPTAGGVEIGVWCSICMSILHPARNPPHPTRARLDRSPGLRRRLEREFKGIAGWTPPVAERRTPFRPPRTPTIF
jgi:hypothetical protein